MHRPRSRTLACLLASCALACGARTVAEDDSDAATAASTSTDTSTSTSTDTSASTSTEGGSESETGPIEDTGSLPPGLSCECVDLDNVCALDGSLAIENCDLPAPCPPVDGSAGAATCVLELLVAQEPVRFRYQYTSTEACGIGNYLWDGWFYVTGLYQYGLMVGLDNECYVDDCNTTALDPKTSTPSATRFLIDPPAYFEDCLGKSAEIMTGCIFNGLTSFASMPECEP